MWNSWTIFNYKAACRSSHLAMHLLVYHTLYGLGTGGDFCLDAVVAAHER